MPVGDVYEFQILGDMQGQPVINVFNYGVTTEGGPEVVAQDFIDAWIAGSLQTKFLLNFAGAYTLQAYRCQRLYNGDTQVLKSLPPVQQLINATGVGGPDPPPSLNTVITVYNTDLGPGEVFFKGRKFLAAGNEAELQDGQIQPDLIITLDDFYTELVLPLDLLSQKVAAFGVWSLKAAKALLPTVFLPVTNFSHRLNTGAMQRRKRGTSRGGFQP